MIDQRERWQLSDHGPKAYERYLVPALFTPWAVDLLARVALQPRERVLDVACGTGIVARLAAQQAGAASQVTGVDLNADMLIEARAQAAKLGAAVDWVEGDVGALPFGAAAFDVVFCQQSIQFFSDQARAVQEIKRVLTPGGRFALNVSRSLEYNPYIRALADALERHVGPEAGAAMRAPCGFGDAEALRKLLTSAHLFDIRIHIVISTIRHPSLSAFIAGQLAATPIAASIAALHANDQRALLDDICVALRPYTDDEGLAVPYEIHVAVAHA
jgi:ubiquinone/menaquinone biosynthesis C-methylase UbiE